MNGFIVRAHRSRSLWFLLNPAVDGPATAAAISMLNSRNCNSIEAQNVFTRNAKVKLIGFLTLSINVDNIVGRLQHWAWTTCIWQFSAVIMDRLHWQLMNFVFFFQNNLTFWMPFRKNGRSTKIDEWKIEYYKLHLAHSFRVSATNFSAKFLAVRCRPSPQLYILILHAHRTHERFCHIAARRIHNRNININQMFEDNVSHSTTTPLLMSLQVTELRFIYSI